MVQGILIGFIIWFVVSLVVLSGYGRSNMIGKTTNAEHLAILLVCLPATLLLCIVALGTEIIEFLGEKTR